MLIRKSEKANLDNKRMILLEIGFIISLGVILLAFNWKSYEKSIQVINRGPAEDMLEEMVPITEQKEPEPPKQEAVKTVSAINIVDDETYIDNDIVVDAEADQTTVIPEYIPSDHIAVKDEESEEAREIFVVVESMPEFPGGEEKLYEYLAQNLKYPLRAREAGIQGKVFLTFVVETDGSITDVKVLRGIGGGCDEEAIRVVEEMPKWIPGRQRGIPVRVQYTLPIKFVLQ